jgi:hypothetical protein
MSNGSNIRSPGYFVARASASCGHCGRLTGVLALALPPDHETLDVDSDDGTWQPTGVCAFIFYATSLPEAVLRRLSPPASLFRLTSDAEAGNSYWANHCGRCGLALEDAELHCEPGVFMPVSEQEAAGIQVLYVDEAFEAAAAGYAPDPAFIRWPSTSSI